MNKSLDAQGALGRIRMFYDFEVDNYSYIEGHSIQEDLDIIKTELKRLEYIEWVYKIINPKFEKNNEILRIIKEKKVRFDILLEVPNAKIYNQWLNRVSTDLDLTQQEFDLLKELFKDEEI